MAKPRKVEEPAAVYTASKSAPKPKATPAEPMIRFAKLEDLKNANARLVQVHRKVLQKLAQ